MDNITELFCQIDDFCKDFRSNGNKYLISQTKRTRNRATCITMSELMLLCSDEFTELPMYRFNYIGVV